MKRSRTHRHGWDESDRRGPRRRRLRLELLESRRLLNGGPKTWYVDDTAGGANNGTDWTNAHTDLQSALAAAASGDEVWVAAGIYKPTSGTDRTISFQLQNGVALYGGFPDGGGNWSSRDWNANLSVFSGNIGTAGDNSDNSYHVVVGSGTDATAILDGFIITFGRADGSDQDQHGGGMYNLLGTPTLANVAFRGNRADTDGGAMHNAHSAPTLTNVTFSGNSATDDGGAMYNYWSSPTLVNATFSGNSAADNGGAMYNDLSAPTLANCILWGDSALTSGNEIYDDANSISTVGYSDVQGGWAGTGNTDLDPKFARNTSPGPDAVWGTSDDDYGDLRLRVNSPAIDAGSNTALPGDLTDMDGDADTTEKTPYDAGKRPRRIDHPRTDTGSGTAPIVDMGAYEASAPASGSLVVTILADEDDGDYSASDLSLREALACANAYFGPDTITFALGLAGTIILGGTELAITDPVTITGPGAKLLTISGDNASRVFNVDDGDPETSLAVNLSGLNVAGGKASVAGGIFNAENLVLSEVVVRDCVAGVAGGGILNEGTLEIRNSTIFGNYAQNIGGRVHPGGGGIADAGTLIITDSTLSGNTADAYGGGILSVEGTVTISNSTISENSAGGGGGIAVSGSITLDSTIVAGNAATVGGPDMYLWEGTTGTATYSLIGNNKDCDSAFPEDTNGPNYIGTAANPIDPLLGPLDDNGGPTPTHALRASSLALDAGRNSQGLATDQRGLPRNVDFPGVSSFDDDTDMGAYEAQGFFAGPYVVSILNDEDDGDYSAGDLSLREAIACANAHTGADAVTFAPGLTGTITLTIGDLLVGDDGTITGPSAEQLTLSGNNASRVFRVYNGDKTSNVTISGLTVTGGAPAEGEWGGGIWNSENLTLQHVVVTGNRGRSATWTDGSGGQGGGIYHVSYGGNPVSTLTLTNCTIANNWTGDGGSNGSGGPGGGISIASGPVIVTNSSITGNHTGSGRVGGFGGGIHSISQDPMTLTDSSISRNWTGNGNGGVGGGGGGILKFNGPMTLINCTLSDNWTGDDTGGGQGGDGGAIYQDLVTTDARLVVINSTLSGNRTGAPNAQGGAVRVKHFNAGNTTEIHNSTIAGNYATGSGGGVYADFETITLDSSIVAGNSASSGLDISLAHGATATATFCLIQDTAGWDPGPGSDANITGVDPQLGPLQNNGGRTPTRALSDRSPAIDKGRNSLPLATDQRGVARTIDAPDMPNGRGDGTDIGAVEMFAGPQTFLVDTAADENDGNVGPGDLSLREAIGLANGSPFDDTITFAAPLSGQTITLTMGQLQIRDDVTITGLGASQLTVSGNDASRVFMVGDENWIPEIAATISGVTIEHGRAPGEGGGIFTEENLLLRDCTIRNNITDSNGGLQDGGGISNWGGSLQVENCTISANHGFWGGGIFSTGGTLTLTNSTVSGNTALGNGGGLCYNSPAAITNTTIYANQAGAEAGGVYVVGATTFSGSIIAGNTAPTAPDISGTATATSCLIGNASGWTPAPGSANNITGQDPLLGPLTDNGGPTPTHALAPGSLALNAGYNPLGLLYDQRGAPYQRTSSLITDIGAYEKVNAAPVLAEIGDKIAYELMLLEFTISATDADWRGETLSYSVDGALPDGASLDPATKLFRWTPHEDQGPQSYEITFRVSDGELSDSETIRITVREAEMQPTSTVVTSSPNPAVTGQAVTFTATVSAAVGTPGGSVQFIVDKALADTVQLNAAGQANTVLSTLNAGNHEVLARYVGRPGFAASDSNTLIQTVDAFPDLVVTDVRHEGAMVYYQVMNAGEASAAANFIVSISINGTEMASSPITVELGPMQRYDGSFLGYPWSATGTSYSVAVTADAALQVRESDEGNNAWTAVWPADREPLVFVSGPTVTDMTADSATIRWETNRAADSRVQYGRRAGEHRLQRYDAAPVTVHVVTLTDLEPAATYQYVVESVDDAGYAARSRTMLLQTASLPDNEDPQLTVDLPNAASGQVVIWADASDNVGIEKVSLYVDGVVVRTEYATLPIPLPGPLAAGAGDARPAAEVRSETFALKLDTTQFADGRHTVQVRASDVSRRSAQQSKEVTFANATIIDGTKPTVTITSPKPGNVTGKVKVTADVGDDTGVAYAMFYVDGVYTEFHPFFRPMFDKNVTFQWDSSTKPLGSKVRLGVEVYDLNGNSAISTVDVVAVNVPVLPPKLVAGGYKVTQKGNYFQIEVTVENTGDGRAGSVVLVDRMDSFYPVSGATLNPLTIYSGRHTPSARMSECVVTTISYLEPHQKYTYTYDVVPVLSYPELVAPPWLGESVALSYKGDDGKEYQGSFWLATTKTTAGVSIPTAYFDALKQADYLITTNPQYLHWQYATQGAQQKDDVNALLSDMATLAQLKQGALGFFYSDQNTTRTELVKRIKPGGAWAKQFSPAFSGLLTGYMLIVGETEIMPSWPAAGSPKWQGYQANYSDHPYADRTGTGTPDLIVGRIIGDSAAALRTPIQASVNVYRDAPGYYFDRHNALLVSEYTLGNWKQRGQETAKTLQSAGFQADQMAWHDYLTYRSLARDYEAEDGFGAADVLGSGLAEIVLADRSQKTVYLYDNQLQELGHFSVPWWNGVAQWSYGLSPQPGEADDAFALGDVDGDGKAEIVLADSSGDGIYVYEPNGVPSYGFLCAFDPEDTLAVGDVDNDGKAEILVGDHSVGKVFIYRVSPAGTTSSAFAFAPGFGRYDGMVVADIRGDSRKEILIGHWSENKLYVYSDAGTKLGSYDLGGSDGWSNGPRLMAGSVNASGTTVVVAPGGSHNHLFAYRWDEKTQKLVGPEGWPDGGFTVGHGMALANVEAVAGNALPSDEFIVASPAGDQITLVDTLVSNFQSRVRQALPSQTPHKDLIAWIGHGNLTVWSGGIASTWDPPNAVFPMDFSGHRPVVLANSCLTGNYQDNYPGGNHENRNIAETFLQSGAAVYIGATEVSFGRGNVLFDQFFDQWPESPAQTVGYAWTKAERDQLAAHTGLDKDAYAFSVWEYNIYGDPKYGATPGASGAASMLQAAATETNAPLPSTTEVRVPDFIVGDWNGLDLVEIPGGQLLSNPGEPALPYYTSQIDIPAGYQVQDVAMIARSAPTTTRGLNVPVNPMVSEFDVLDYLPNPGTQGWYPEEPYTWQTIANPDGSATLVISVFPFRYNSRTTQAEFYQDYTFRIDATASMVEITSLTTDRAEYAVGDRVSVEMEVVNSGPAQDVIVETVVKSYGSEEIVAGLLLQQLSGLEGEAGLTSRWDTAGVAPGFYSIETTLSDTSGHVLARRSEVFRVGTDSVEIVSLAATPRQTDPAARWIDVDVQLANTGTEPLASGELLVTIFDAAGEQVGWYSHDISGLAPSVPTDFHDTLDVSGLAAKGYHVVAHVNYDGLSAAPAAVDVGFDFGDAPAPHPTLLAANGARHVLAGPWLGPEVDTRDWEPDGKPDPAALADLDDGVTMPPVFTQGLTQNIDVQVHGGGGVLEMWLDANGDGSWSEPAELVYRSRVSDGRVRIPVTLPAGRFAGQTFARFRISTQGTNSPVGPAPDGEVEDYAVRINDVPQIVGVHDLSIDMNSPAAIGITIEDMEPLVGSGMVLTATSNNAQLVPDGNLMATGSGLNWTIQATPVPGRWGSAVITVTATDGYGVSQSESFTLTVNPVVQLSSKRANNVVVSLKGQHVQVVDVRNKKVPLLDAPLGSFQKLTIAGSASMVDTLTIDFAAGGTFAIPDGIVFDGGTALSTRRQPADTLTLRGTALSDRFLAASGAATINDLNVVFSNVEQLKLDGGAGNDAYRVSDLSTGTAIVDADKKSTDELDFSQAAVGANVNLGSTRPQQVFASKPKLTLTGAFENVVGTPYSDNITGNSRPNKIWGGGGNDTVRGGGGNDILYGEEGDDWLYGDAGNDFLYGGPGNNVLLGGNGNDTLDVDVPAGLATGLTARNLLVGGLGADVLQGGPGEEILIGGTTRYDSKAAALGAVMREWTSDNAYDTRCVNLDTGIPDPLAGFIQLKKKDKANPKGTVIDDRVRDQLFGGQGDDWFFDFTKDETDADPAGR